MVPLAIGVALGFAMRALAELFLLGRGWRTTFEEGVYPFSFVLAMTGVFMGGLLLLAFVTSTACEKAYWSCHFHGLIFRCSMTLVLAFDQRGASGLSRCLNVWSKRSGVPLSELM